MDEREPVRAKPSTGKAFRPRLELDGPRVEAAQRIVWTDGSFGRYEVHPEWLAQLRREAQLLNSHASTSIEGNPLSLDEVRRIAPPEPRADAASSNDPHAREILQHISYFRRLREAAAQGLGPIEAAEVVQTQRELLGGVIRDSHLGRLRGPQHSVSVQFGKNQGTPPQHVAEELDALQAWFLGEGRRLPTPIRVAVWFHEFESIHPFSDGNGRVGRALTHRLLLTDGLPNSVYVALDAPFNEDRDAYYGALDSVRSSGRYEEWVDYFLSCLWDAYQRSLRVLQRVTSVPAGFAGAQRAILEHALRTGIDELRVAPLTRALETYQPITITVALRALHDEHGLVQHNGKRGRASAYVVTERFRALTKAVSLTPGA
jgi:hypothetical protein